MPFELTSGAMAALLLAGGCLNGMIAQAESNWRIEGAVTLIQFFGFGFFVPFSIYVAMKLLNDGGDALPPRSLGLAALIYAATVLVPSSLVSWLSVALFATWIAWHAPLKPRIGALLFLALALVMIWTSAGVKLFIDRVTAFDAWMLQHLLMLLSFDIQRNGNLVTAASGHNVVILLDCATLKRLPLGLLSCFSASLLAGRLMPARPLLLSLSLLALGLTLLNAVRLTLLSLSPQAYDLIHGDVGKSLYDALETLIVIWIGFSLGEHRLSRPLPALERVA